MSKPLFEFVKVAAGEPVDTGSLVCYMQPDVRAMVRELSFGPGGKAPHDIYILRPAESPDAGREGLADDIQIHFAKGTAAIYTEYAGETTKALTALKEIALRLLSTPADPIRVTKDDAIEWLLTKGIQGLEKREKMWVEHGGSTLFDYLQGKTITPADPGSQVEAVLNWINENMPGLYVNQPVWSIETHDPAGFESDSSKEVNYSTADLITLYKQSL